jgi:hypothetical protein
MLLDCALSVVEQTGIKILSLGITILSATNQWVRSVTIEWNLRVVNTAVKILLFKLPHFELFGPKHSQDQNKINDFNAAIKAI